MTADPSGSGTGPGRDAAAGEPSRVCLAALPAAGQAAGMARCGVRGALASWGLAHLEETAALLVSELAGNAVRHARADGSRLVLRLEAAAVGAVLGSEPSGDQGGALRLNKSASDAHAVVLTATGRSWAGSTPARSLVRRRVSRAGRQSRH